jgi:hypothetical protein
MFIRFEVSKATLDARYLLWSGAHSAWWRPGALGYTTDRDQAGRFTIEQAMRYIVASADSGDAGLVTRLVIDTPSDDDIPPPAMGTRDSARSGRHP